MNTKQVTYFSLCIVLSCLAGLGSGAEASENCVKSLRAIRFFSGLTWSPVISFWGDADVRTDPIWNSAVKKYEKSEQRTLIQIKESDSSPVEEYEFKMKNRKISEVIVKQDSRETYNITLTPDCQIQQIRIGVAAARNDPNEIRYDRELCDRLNKQKIDQAKIDQCRDVFAEVRAAIEKRNNELKKEGKYLSTQKNVDESIRPYLQTLSNCEQLRTASYLSDVRESGTKFKNEATGK